MNLLNIEFQPSNLLFIGPQTWSEKFAGAAGKHQSPINIDTSLAKYDSGLSLNPLKINYDNDSCFQIKNTGHTFQVDGFKMNKSSKNSSLLL